MYTGVVAYWSGYTDASAFRYAGGDGWSLAPYTYAFLPVKGGNGSYAITIWATQGFRYYGFFSFYMEGWYYNRLSMWITIRGNGTFSCAYEQYARRNPGDFLIFRLSFVYPRATCYRY